MRVTRRRSGRGALGQLLLHQRRELTDVLQLLHLRCLELDAAIPRHRLKREIITTATTNSLINRMGPTFVARTQEETGAEPADIARAYSAASRTWVSPRG